MQQAISHLPTTVPRPCVLPLNHNAAAAAATTMECNSAVQSFTSAAPSHRDDTLDQGEDGSTQEEENVFMKGRMEDDANEMETTAGFPDSDANNNVKLREGNAVSNKVEENDSQSNM